MAREQSKSHSLRVGESLGVDYDERRKKQHHILGAHLGDGTELPYFQDPWEGGFGVLPLVLHLNGGRIARGSVAVPGPHSPVSIKLPHAPERVELDPDLWVLSDKTSISKQ